MAFASIIEKGCVKRGKERGLKTFFDGIFMDKDKLCEEDIKYPIKLEYYKTIAIDENVEAKYGIEIVKIEYKNGNVEIETNKLDNVTSNLEEVNEILTILRNNEVTPIGMQDVLDDMFTKV